MCTFIYTAGEKRRDRRRGRKRGTLLRSRLCEATRGGGHSTMRINMFKHFWTCSHFRNHLATLLDETFGTLCNPAPPTSSSSSSSSQRWLLQGLSNRKGRGRRRGGGGELAAWKEEEEKSMTAVGRLTEGRGRGERKKKREEEKRGALS